MAVKKAASKAPETVTVGGKEYPYAPLEMPRSNVPEAEWMAITPGVMEKWLNWNRSNRNVRANLRDSHAEDMGEGNWKVNGEAIKLSRPLKAGEIDDMPEGSILFLDGQHRGEACIKSGKPFVSLVVYGLEPDARETMDSGVSRNMADVQHMAGEKHSPVQASVLRRVYLWDRNDRRFNGSARPTHAQLRKLFKSDEKGFRNAADKGYWVRKTYKDLPPSIIATAWYLLNRVSPEDAPWFFSSLKTGADLSENHPILTLRNRLARDRAEKKPSIAYHQLAMVIRAWNAYRSNELLSRMDQPLGAETPDPK